MQIFNQCPPVVAAPWPVAYAPAFSAGAVVIVGVVAATIAYRQWVTASTKLRLDLYDKRRPIYVACRDLIHSIFDSADAVRPVLKAFHSADADAAFLCGPDVDDFMTRLWMEAEHERELLRGMRGGNSVDGRAEAWQMQARSEVEDVFAPYLRLTALPRFRQRA